MFDRKKYKDFAKIQLRDRWPIPMIITLFTLIINNLFSIADRVTSSSGMTVEEMRDFINSGYSGLMSYLGKNPKEIVIAFIFSFINSIISFILGYGAICVYLKMSRSPNPVSFSTFTEGLNDWIRAILTGLWQLLWILIWSLIVIPVSFAATYFAVLFLTNLPMLTVTTFIMIFSTLGFIPAVIKSIAYSQMFYIVCECPDVSIINSMKISKKITEGHKMDIFLTVLSFTGYFIIGFATLGILNLWITPYFKMTMTNVYHALLKEALEKGIVTPQDLKTIYNSDTDSVEATNSDGMLEIQNKNEEDEKNE